MLYAIPEWCRIIFKSRTVRHAGFADICYVQIPGTLCESIARAEVDLGRDFSAPRIIPIDVGVPAVMQFIK